MKKLLYPLQLLLSIFLCSSFVVDNDAPLALVSTKWISPTNDNCSYSLCFTSENTVMLYRCDDEFYYEVGYCIKGNNIEIEAYKDETREKTGKLILMEDNGILRQLDGQVNTFPKKKLFLE